MKTIDIDDNLYEQLLALSQEIASQGNRGTAKPYLFQVQTDYKVWDTGLNGDVKVILSEDFEEIGPLTKATVFGITQRNELEPPDWIDDIDAGYVSTCDVREWLNDIRRGMILTSYSIAHKYENGFLTEKACQAHINGNKHHYDNPADYLSHAFRNPEMELIYKFLETLTVKTTNEQANQKAD